MRYISSIVICLSLMTFSAIGISAPRFSETLCHQPDYSCYTVKAGDTWESLFSNEEHVDMLKRVNRMNVTLKPGMILAIPVNIERITIYDVAPFPRFIEPDGEKTIFVNQKLLAWGAYDAEGQLVWWGPISSGSGHCAKLDGDCLTPTGAFRVIRKQDYDCVSTVFPRRANGESGGAEMPYCVHFFRGYALHGSEDVPGYRSSHGCVRMFIEDARWLNEEFVELPGAGGLKGTRVIIDNLTS